MQCRYRADGSALLTPILLYGCHRHVAGSSLCTALYTFLPCPPKQSMPCCPTAVKVCAARAGGVVLPSLHRCQVMDSAQSIDWVCAYKTEVDESTQCGHCCTQARDGFAMMLLLLTWAPTSTQLIEARKSLAALSAAIDKHLLANAACGMSIHGWWPFLSRPLQCLPLILVCKIKQLLGTRTRTQTDTV